MNVLSASDIRNKFVAFFEAKGHKHLPSSPLIPYNDPTVLLTTAGMLQFKPIMFGTEAPSTPRAVTHQKCFRTTDLDNVGFTPRHHTFFEMLGNFSFGDYYKAEVIPWAWEFLTRELGLPPERLYVSVFESDDEAETIWREKVGVPADHIARLGEADNFWAAGDTGPCGPCSEIYYDLGENMGSRPFAEDVLNDGNRYLEVWNLVFMEFNRQPDGTLLPLPAKNIDTGMGLERIASVVQGKQSNYECDLLQAIIDTARPLASTESATHPRYQTALQVIADHIRASVMLIGDGVTPGNEGRGYVLRRIMRRAIRFGHLLGIQEAFLHRLIPVVLAQYHHMPELQARQNLIHETILAEEERFSKTLNRGMKKLEEALADLGQQKQVPGSVAFELYDTYGFPLELTQEIAQEQGLSVDEAGYQQAMREQVERARAAARSSLDIGAGVVGLAPTVFTGYETLSQEAEILAVLDSGKPELRRVVLAQTPFYAESGGQVSDHGLLQAGAHRYEVVDVQKVGEVFVHVVQGESWEALESAGSVLASVAESTRRETMKHHSVTHLLHQALKDVLGDQVAQAGSEVTHYHTRFDFSFNRAVTPEELQQIEELVNAQIMLNHPVSTAVMPLEEARQSGAVAMFGEKYGDTVRVIAMGGYSKEFCGGTHVPATGTIGSFKIVSEEAIAAGVRRLIAVAGKQAYLYNRQNDQLLKGLARELKVPFGDIPGRLQKMQESLRAQEKELKQLKQQIALQQVAGLAQQFQEHQGVSVLAAEISVADMNGLKQIAETLKGQHPQAVVVLGAVIDEKVALVAAVEQGLSKTIKAGDLIRQLAPRVGAKGGGKPEFAQAGGGDQPAGLKDLQAAVMALLPQGVSV